MIVKITVVRYVSEPWAKEFPDNPVNIEFRSVNEVEVYCIELAQGENVCEVNAWGDNRLLVNLHKSKKISGKNFTQTIVNKFQ